MPDIACNILHASGKCPSAECVVHFFVTQPMNLQHECTGPALDISWNCLIQHEWWYASVYMAVLQNVNDCRGCVTLLFQRLRTSLKQKNAEVWGILEAVFGERYGCRSYCHSRVFLTTGWYKSISEGTACRTKYQEQDFHDGMYLWGHGYKWNHQTTEPFTLVAE